MGLSRKLSKRKCRPGSSDLPNESQSKKTLRRLRRAMTTMKEVERRVEEMTSSSAAMKLETARMRDEAIRARDEAFIARDEAHRLRDEAEGLNAEASMANADASRLRDEAAAFRDEAERIYADIAAVKDDYERAAAGGYPFEGDEAMSSSTDSSNWRGEDYLYEEGDSSSVEEVATAYDVAPLCVERPIDGVSTLFDGLEVGDNSGLVANDGNEGDPGDGVGEEGEGGSAMPIGVHKDGGDGGAIAGDTKPANAGQEDEVLSYAGPTDAAPTNVAPSHAGAADGGPTDVVDDGVVVADAAPALRRSTRVKKISSTLTSPYTVSRVSTRSMR